MKTRRSWLATVSGAAASARGGALLCVVAQHGAHGDDSLSTLTTELFQRAFVPLRGECATGRFFLPLPLTCTCMFVRVTDSLQIWYVAGCCAANCTTVIRNSSLSIANRSTTMTITMALLDDAVTQMSQALPHIHQRYNMVMVLLLLSAQHHAKRHSATIQFYFVLDWSATIAVARTIFVAGRAITTRNGVVCELGSHCAARWQITLFFVGGVQ